MPSKTQKSLNFKKNISFLKDQNIDYIEYNGGMQWNFIFCRNRVAAFYPTTNKWVCDGKTYHGNIVNLWDWIGEMEEK